jgi:hypothetical protein
MTQQITFVTSVMNIYDAPYDEKTTEWRFERFAELAKTGILLCIYCDESMFSLCLDFVGKYDNVKIAKVMNIEDTAVARECSLLGEEWSLPEHRSVIKDLPKYMFMMNSKFEFMNDAAEQNLWGTSYFAWIDFSVTYVFKRMNMTLEYLRTLARRPLRGSFLTIPGCHDQGGGGDEEVLKRVVWRFCGGFFLGDRDSMKEAFGYYSRYFGEFMRKHQVLVWEVNFWAWLEKNTDWAPRWYKADHNDTIVEIPVDLYVCSLVDTGRILKKVVYDYPLIENNEPMQVSYVEYDGRRFINTRYVNYWYLDSGHCHINDEEGRIITRNMVSELDEGLKPLYYGEMRETDTVGLESKKTAMFHGLEDVRLYVWNGRLKFIATNINYSPTGWNSMIVGEYRPDDRAYYDCRVVGSPYDSWCEKNWIPVVVRVEDGKKEKEKEMFIYRWWPQLEIGVVNYDTERLEIVEKWDVGATLFEKVRGSSAFVEDWSGKWLVGLVHFSENTCPRRYYHIFVALNRENLKPVKYSAPFYFQHLGIEFCTGIKRGEEEGKYVCWVSKWDREPAMVEVEMLDLAYEFSC